MYAVSQLNYLSFENPNIRFDIFHLNECVKFQTLFLQLHFAGVPGLFTFIKRSSSFLSVG